MRYRSSLFTVAALASLSAPSGRHISLEDEADGVKRVEKEREFYVQLSDLEQLKKATSKESQEQWTIKLEKTDDNAGSGNFRVRKVDTEGVIKYIFTTKTVQGQGLRDECSVEVSEQMFNMFKVLAETGMIKDRYSFPVEGTDLVYEVDMFLKPDGSYHPWAKIDLENPPEQPPPLPVVVDAFIDGKTQDAEQRKQITQLYEDMFLTPNHFVNGEPAEGGGVTLTPGVTENTPDAVTPTVPAADANDEKKESAGEGDEVNTPSSEVTEAGTDTSEDGKYTQKLAALVKRRNP
jgi:hypothetical protein